MNVLITGASKGIGYELGKHFAFLGAKTIFLLSRNKEKITFLKAECEKINDKVNIVLLPFSLEEDGSFDAINNVIVKNVNHLDIVINNAGFLLNKPFEKISVNEIRKIYEVNVFGPFRLIQTLLKFLGGELKTHIVNIGSMGGIQGQSKFAGLSAYSSSKMAIAGLSECLAEELKDKNISVNCLALGAVNTEMLNEAFPGYKAPLEATEIAVFIADFCINGHKFINGKIIPVAMSTP